MEVVVFKQPVLLAELRRLASQTFGDMVKAVVDVEQGTLAVGGDLHADAEAVLRQRGSQQDHLWGINLYPDRPAAERIEFTSLINVRPSQGNRSMEVQDPALRDRIAAIVARLITEP